PSETCVRKNGLYGTRTRSGAFVAREPNQKLITSRPTSSATHCQPIRKRGFGGCAGAGGGVLIRAHCHADVGSAFERTRAGQRSTDRARAILAAHCAPPRAG